MYVCIKKVYKLYKNLSGQQLLEWYFILSNPDVS